VSANRAKKGHYFVALKPNQPLTLEAVALSCADPWTPRERVVVGGGRHGDREERRTLEASTEVVAYLAHPEALDPVEGEAGTMAGWPALAQVCRIHRDVEYVSGARAGEGRAAWADALTSLPPDAGGRGALGTVVARPLADRERLALRARCDPGRGRLPGAF
jgi:hypothetical protein